MFASKMAWLECFPNSYAATGNRTQVSKVAPEPLNDALPTEPPRLRRGGNVWNMVPKDQKAEQNLFSKVLSFSKENKLVACFFEQ